MKYKVICCEQYRMDYMSLIEKKYLDRVEVVTFSCLCSNPGNKKTVHDQINAIQGKGLLLCSDNCDANKVKNEQLSYINNPYCYPYAAENGILDYIHSKGGYIISSDYLLHWETNLKRDGFTQSTAKVFYKEVASELVYFNKGVLEDFETRLKSFAAYVDRSYSVLQMGNEHFKLYLNALLGSKLEEANYDKKTMELKQLKKQYSEIQLITRLTEELMNCNSKDLVVHKLKETFMLLFGALSIEYMPNTPELCGKGQLWDVNGMLGSDYIIKNESEILFRVAHQDKVCGFIKMKDFIKPNYIKYYVELALRICKVAAVVMVMIERMDYEVIQRTNDELIHLNDMLEKTTVMKEQFIATMSHEIRTPLNGFLGMLQLLDDSPLNQKQRELLNTCFTSSELLMEIVNNILDYSKLETGMVKLVQKEFDLRSTLDHMTKLFMPLANEKGNSLSLAIESDLPVNIYGDETRIKQILNNMLSNAIKFTDEGTISISVYHETINRTSIKLIFKISDSGIGIRASDLNSVFDHFTQVHTSNSENYGGTGLGLAISKHLVELMNGTIDVESDFGVGSVFTIAFTVKPSFNVNTDKVEYSEKEKGSTESLRILIAEDDPVSGLYIRQLAEKYNWSYDFAVNGKEAVEFARSKEYDVILMDSQMPILSGEAATKEIRQSGKNKNVPIVALTANALYGHRQKYLELGMDDYMSKPFAPDKLVDLLLKWKKN